MLLLKASSLPRFFLFKQKGKKEIHNVSIINLITTPDLYHNTKINIIGYIGVEFGRDAIYLHKEDYENGLMINSIELFLKESQKDDIQYGLNYRYVILEGIFDKNSTHYNYLFNGCIKEISRIDKWLSRSEIKKITMDCREVNS